MCTDVRPVSVTIVLDDAPTPPGDASQVLRQYSAALSGAGAGHGETRFPVPHGRHREAMALGLRGEAGPILPVSPL